MNQINQSRIALCIKFLLTLRRLTKVLCFSIRWKKKVERMTQHLWLTAHICESDPELVILDTRYKKIWIKRRELEQEFEMGLIEYVKSINWEQEAYPSYQDFAVLPFFALFFPSVRFLLDRFVFEVLWFLFCTWIWIEFWFFFLVSVNL